MNKQIAGTELEGKSLEEIVLASWNKGSPTPVFNNAAQVRSHTVVPLAAPRAAVAAARLRPLAAAPCCVCVLPLCVGAWP